MVNGERWAMDESQNSSCEDGRLCCLNDWQCESCLSARIRMPRFRVGEKINDIHNSWLPGFVILTTQKTLCIEHRQSRHNDSNFVHHRRKYPISKDIFLPPYERPIPSCRNGFRNLQSKWKADAYWLGASACVACGLANCTICTVPGPWRGN